MGFMKDIFDKPIITDDMMIDVVLPDEEDDQQGEKKTPPVKGKIPAAQPKAEAKD